MNSISDLSVFSVNKEREISDTPTKLGDFWRDQDCVIVFFRRFGCAACRHQAKSYSDELKPILDSHNVRLLGIGFDARYTNFQFSVYMIELFVDPDFATYKALDFKRLTKREMVSRKLITIMTRLAEKEGISNDLHGNLSQNGGVVIVRKGGKVLETFKQDLTDEDKIAMKSEDILKALNIDTSRLPKPVVQDA